MERWIIYALISMLFAGFTSVIAKYGMKNVGGDTALVVRTSMVFLLVWLNAFVFNHTKGLNVLTKKDILFLCLSGITTTVSWVFYYRAMKEGNVSVVATIDKASIVVTLLLSFIILKEPFTWQIGVAGILITSGLLLLIYK
jgi:bacterial/archaeal transporter family protein